VDLEDRVPTKHPLRLIRRIVNDMLRALDGEFAKLCADSGRPSIAPERLLRAQAFYTIRSESQLMEQLNYNLLYRWFVGLGSTSRCGCEQCSPRTASGCWRRRLRTSSWLSC
jgi:transposase